MAQHSSREHFPYLQENLQSHQVKYEFFALSSYTKCYYITTQRGKMNKKFNFIWVAAFDIKDHLTA
jgi:hypothetical protein